jgi:pyruvate dehydrogenase E2 component (dihydrolipoamide acetyltransferase)
LVREEDLMTFEFKLPDIGEGVVEGEIVRWLISEGDSIEEDQPMVEVMTDKATVEIPSPVRGTVVGRLGSEGDTVAVGNTLVVLEVTNGSQEPVEKERLDFEESQPTVRQPAPPRAGTVLATPAVRKLARELGIDLTGVEGTGPGGRITREDLEATGTAPQERASSLQRPQGREESETESETIPYRGLRRKIGAHMVASKRSAVHYTYVEEVDASGLVQLRRNASAMLPEGQQITYLPFIIKAVVEGLKRYPLLNSTLDEEREQIVVKKYYNIGVATATEDGLIVPVLKAADRYSIIALGQEISRLSEAARRGTIALEDLKDSTFTITSLGALGGLMATPVINYPEVAILGVHKISPRPAVVDGVVAVREMMNLSLSLDHRVVDGAIGAQFMNYVIQFLENPALLLLMQEN